MKKKVATLLRALADRLYTPPTLIKPLECFGIPVEPVRIRSNYALTPGNFKKADPAEFKKYCVQDLKEQIAQTVHIVNEGGAVCADLLILKPIGDGK